MPASDQKAFRILLVEDEPVIRELVSSLLEEEGPVEVDCAADGAEGLELARSRAYDLFLLDVVLPHINGFELCRLLKSEGRTSGVPLYMLTAKSRKQDLDAANHAGADGYIQKPFRGAELMGLVERLRTSP